jgi:bifunctional enzyme Fae/Hps
LLDPNTRYLQIAFNTDARQVRRILPKIPYDPRIIIEAGTPYIKLTGMHGVGLIRRLWRGLVVADLKVTDGAVNEVMFASQAGATAVTVMGSAPTETIDLFNRTCSARGIYSMVDMLGVDNPLKHLLPLKTRPDFVVIHKGRDEESTRRKIIRYKDIAKIHSKFDSFISVAGGLEPNGVRSAYFNGADVAILNVVRQGDPYKGILETADFKNLIPEILREVGK